MLYIIRGFERHILNKGIKDQIYFVEKKIITNCVTIAISPKGLFKALSDVSGVMYGLKIWAGTMSPTRSFETLLTPRGDRGKR